MKVKVKNIRVFVIENDAHIGYGITANDRYGREYSLLDGDNGYRVMSYVKSEMVIDKIKAAGSMISMDHWAVHIPYGTEAWLMDGMEERQIEDERFGYC